MNLQQIMNWEPEWKSSGLACQVYLEPCSHDIIARTTMGLSKLLMNELKSINLTSYLKRFLIHTLFKGKSKNFISKIQ